MNNLKIELSPEAQKFAEGLPTRPGRALSAVAKALDQANELAKANIENKHLTGQGPFPVSEHKLGTVSNRLRKSMWASPALVQGNKVTSAIGSNVVYAAIHEFGGTIQRKARAGTVRLRTDKDGNLIRQSGNPHLAIFARGSHKRVKEVAYKAEAYEIEMPERSPVRTGIAEMQPTYQKLISAAVIKALKN